jgi:Flp pilus assembly pilin Flp
MSVRSGARWTDEQGSAAIEFALVAPLLFIIVFAIIDFSRAYYTLNDLTAAVREGARYASSLDDPLVRHPDRSHFRSRGTRARGDHRLPLRVPDAAPGSLGTQRREYHSPGDHEMGTSTGAVAGALTQRSGA